MTGRAAVFHPPVKRSITIAGHPTSIALEPLFWATIEAAAATRDLPLSALVAQIDAERLTAPNPPNLASAIRCWLYAMICDKDANVSQLR